MLGKSQPWLKKTVSANGCFLGWLKITGPGPTKPQHPLGSHGLDQAVSDGLGWMKKADNQWLLAGHPSLSLVYHGLSILP